MEHDLFVFYNGYINTPFAFSVCLLALGSLILTSCNYRNSFVLFFHKSLKQSVNNSNSSSRSSSDGDNKCDEFLLFAAKLTIYDVKNKCAKQHFI
jgi:hypothetical protein